ncbi:MAG TPA: branched-chain amino acid ABC transporter substrate-binding protein [Solirubrobacteraceae bacterium]
MGTAQLKYWIGAGLGLLIVAGGVAWALVAPAEDELTIYASLPLQGTLHERSADMDRGMRLALKEARNRAGDFKIRYRLLDDSSSKDRGWTEARVARNANRAADDEHTAAYLGEFNSGATEISILILSGKRVPQISPGSTKVGLTSKGPGAGGGEPDRYYQGDRNFVRVVPNDTVQGRALAAIMEEDGCRRIGMLNDQEPYGAGLARNVRVAARQRSMPIVLDGSFEKTTDDFDPQAHRAARLHVDCFLFSGDSKSNAELVYGAMYRALPAGTRLYGGDGVSDTEFTDLVPAKIASHMQLTTPAIAPAGLAETGKRFFARYENEYPDRPDPDPYAIYAYESMKLALDAIERSGSGEREDIIKALFATKNHQSVLGTYSIDRNGDTTLTDYGRFDIKDGKPRFRQTIDTALAQ